MPTLNWIGKEAVINHHRQVPYHLLRSDNSLSCGDPESGNLLVEGDNLLALKALLPYYAGQVKCIYIDPPYNTGNEKWKYNDNVNSPEIRKWLGRVVGAEAEDLSRHDKWLCMMYPRLSILKHFLQDDGVIIVHIDEHEIGNLFLLLDDIYGRNNFLGYIVWDKGNPKGDAQGVAFQHETVLCYALKKDRFLNTNKLLRPKLNADKILKKAAQLYDKLGKKSIPDDIINIKKKYNLPYSFDEYETEWTLEKINNEFQAWMKQQSEFSGGEKMYKYIDSNGYVYRLVSMAWPNKKKAPDEYFLPIKHPTTNQNCPVPNRGWRFPPDTIKELLDKNEIIFGKDHTTQPQRIYFLKDNMEENLPSILKYAGSDDDFFRNIYINFENPKPYLFSKYLLNCFTRKGDLILDSFAGSGTTGHAVLDINKKDGGNRRFILIEMDQDVCRNVAAQRLKKAIQGYEMNGKKNLSVEGLGGGFRYCKLDKPLFDETGKIGETVRFGDLASHIFFTETGKPIPKRVNGASPFLGTANGTGYYLLFNGILGDKTPDGGNVLTGKVLMNLPKHNGPKVIFGEGCRLGEARLRREHVIFKQLPYEIKVS